MKSGNSCATGPPPDPSVEAQLEDLLCWAEDYLVEEPSLHGQCEAIVHAGHAQEDQQEIEAIYKHELRRLVDENSKLRMKLHTELAGLAFGLQEGRAAHQEEVCEMQVRLEEQATELRAVRQDRQAQLAELGMVRQAKREMEQQLEALQSRSSSERGRLQVALGFTVVLLLIALWVCHTAPLEGSSPCSREMFMSALQFFIESFSSMPGEGNTAPTFAKVGFPPALSDSSDGTSDNSPSPTLQPMVQSCAAAHLAIIRCRVLDCKRIG